MLSTVCKIELYHLIPRRLGLLSTLKRLKHNKADDQPGDHFAVLSDQSKKTIAPKTINSKIAEWEHYDGPRKLVFQELRLPSTCEPIYTLAEAAEPTIGIGRNVIYKYPKLATQHTDHAYVMRGVNNEDTRVVNFPELTDFTIVGSSLFGSACAYYIKKNINRTGDVVVIDKDPYTPHVSDAVCSGLISSQSKSRDIVRLASLTKELIRELRTDIMVTNEDFAKINYRPVTHLILWPQEEVDSVLSSVDMQLEDGCFVEAETPLELETTYPWLKVNESDVALGTFGAQDEALVDTIALRNLYRTLAQAYGASFILGEGIDFNTCYPKDSLEINPLSVGALVFRNPTTGELRNVHASCNILCCGYNTPFLEAKSELSSSMRDQLEDLHFIKPRLRVCFSFNSLSAPIINFPVITDTDGSMLLRDDYFGNFKYYLTLEESEDIFEEEFEAVTGSDPEQSYPNLYHKSQYFINYFDRVIKPRLVKRIPSMEDSKFNIAFTGFQNYNSHDGSPIVSTHPHHQRVYLAAGFGSRNALLSPTCAAALGQLCCNMFEPTDDLIYDLSQFYWSRVLRGRKIEEYKSLIK